MGERANKRSYTQGRRDAARGRSPRNERQASPARQQALRAVRLIRERDAFAQEIMAQTVDRAHLSPADRAFATRLVLGVVSMRGVLDEVLDRCMRSPDDVTCEVRDALEISTYEILFLDKSPHAAVDQGVELVRGVAPRAGGVANAVLRNVVRAKPSFPFGNPSSDIEAYARLHGFPAWLAQRLVDDLGASAAHELIKASNEPAPVFVAVNAARATDDEVVSVLAEADAHPEAALVNGCEVAGCFRLADGRVLLDERVRALIDGGCLLVSDAASQAVAALVLPRERPASFLEIGAGRATKTILIQSNAYRRWGAAVDEYVALDSRSFKSELLKQRICTYNTPVSEVLTGDATCLDKTIGSRLFDVVFIDAPCTGVGTLRRHPEIRWHLRPEASSDLAELGLAMLKSAASHVSENGVLAYATCTVFPEENAQVIARFLKSEQGRGFSLEPVCGASAFASNVSVGGCDAHFCALMRRRTV